MAHDSGPHPLCICPPITFSGPAPDRDACRRRAAPLDPHPVLTAEDLAAVLEDFRAGRYETPSRRY